jgi:hypothetical protein
MPAGRAVSVYPFVLVFEVTIHLSHLSVCNLLRCSACRFNVPACPGYEKVLTLGKTRTGAIFLDVGTGRKL